MLKISRLKLIICAIFVITVLYFGLGSLYATYKGEDRLSFMPKLNLGLDLRGGASLLLEVNDEEYFSEYLQSIADKIVNTCEKKGNNILKQSIDSKNGVFFLKYQSVNALHANKSESTSANHAKHSDKNENYLSKTSSVITSEHMAHAFMETLNNYINRQDYQLEIIALPGQVSEYNDAQQTALLNESNHISLDNKLKNKEKSADGANNDEKNSKELFQSQIFECKVQIKPALLQSIKDNLLQQSLHIIRKRIDESGTREINLQRQGDRYILLEVPGVNDTQQIKKLLGATAKLSFHLVDQSVTLADIEAKKIPVGTKLLPMLLEPQNGNIKDKNKNNSSAPHSEKSSNRNIVAKQEKTHSFKGKKQEIKTKKIDLASGKIINNDKIIYIPIKKRAALNGDLLLDAQVNQSLGQYIVTFRLNNAGAKIFANLTAHNIGQVLAIVLDDKVISAPGIREAIPTGNGSISGNFTLESATDLALLLRSGALPAHLEVIEERNLGPSLGQSSIESGAKAAAIGALSVMCIMLIFYGRLGIFANCALIINMLAILAIMSAIGATLTLPGIAGIALTLGMAVDANVLVFERMREEISKGASTIQAITSGYNMAFVTIFDANFTTVAAAVILYIFGTSAVKGFAVTLVIGIACSMYTAVQLSKIMLYFWIRWFKPRSLIM